MSVNVILFSTNRLYYIYIKYLFNLNCYKYKCHIQRMYSVVSGKHSKLASDSSNISLRAALILETAAQIRLDHTCSEAEPAAIKSFETEAPAFPIVDWSLTGLFCWAAATRVFIYKPHLHFTAENIQPAAQPGASKCHHRQRIVCDSHI